MLVTVSSDDASPPEEVTIDVLPLKMYLGVTEIEVIVTTHGMMKHTTDIDKCRSIPRVLAVSVDCSRSGLNILTKPLHVRLPGRI